MGVQYLDREMHAPLGIVRSFSKAPSRGVPVNRELVLQHDRCQLDVFTEDLSMNSGESQPHSV